MDITIERGDLRFLIETLDEFSATLSKKHTQIHEKISQRQEKVNAQEILLEESSTKHAGTIEMMEMEVEKHNEYIEKQSALGIALGQKISEARRLKTLFVEELKKEREANS